MKNLIYINLLCIMCISLFAISQEFDDDFLQSLPEEVQKEILAEQEKSKEQNKNIAKRPSSELSKLDTVKAWEEFQKQELFSKSKSKRYGLNMFRTMQSSFMPINDPNFNTNYILDFGDVIDIQTIGVNIGFNGDNEIIIDRDGSIVLPQLGKIFIGGLKLQQAIDLIKEKFAKNYVGAEIIISLKNIRDIKIFMTGHISYPGMYTLNGNSSVLNALNIAGGVKESGSLRDVQIKRDGIVIKNVDLYKILISGDTSSNMDQLRSGDVIHILPVKNIASTISGFNIDASFELKDSETLKDLYTFAGGPSKGAFKNNIILSRFEKKSFNRQEIKYDDLSSININNADSLYITENNFGTVEISGEVVNPGVYPISDIDSLSSLVTRAGGYKASAYPYGSLLFREKAKKLESEHALKLYNDLVRYIASTKGGFEADPETLSFILYELKQFNPTGRVSVEFDLDSIKEDPRNDTLLNDKDKIVIPKYDENVYVFGEVAKSGAVRYKNNKDISYYIANSGGATTYADDSHVLVIDPDGRSHQVKSKLLFLRQNQDTEIYPGSIVYLPRELGRIEGIDLFSVAAPIFSSFALTAVTYSALNNNNNNNNSND